MTFRFAALFSLWLLLGGPSLSAVADSHEKNMPTFADGHDEDSPTPDFSAKPASEHTAKVNREAAKRLPYADKTAFEQQARGLIAPFGDHAAGKIRIPFHDFLKGASPEDHPDTINPSIFHQAVMNYQAQGLYKVVEGVYQLRGNEISNITIFRTKSGYVLNDLGLVDGTMRDAWEFAKKHLPEPHTIHAVVYSHPHADTSPHCHAETFPDPGLYDSAGQGRSSSYQYQSW